MKTGREMIETLEFNRTEDFCNTFQEGLESYKLSYYIREKNSVNSKGTLFIQQLFGLVRLAHKLTDHQLFAIVQNSICMA